MTTVNEGRHGPRWPTVGALALTMVLGVPLTVWGLTSTGKLPIDRAVKVPVVRQADLAAQGTPVRVVETTTEPQVAEVRLDARTLLEMFRGQDYRIEALRSGELPVPRVRLASMPRDMGETVSPDERKQLFIKTMLPLILLSNERIEQDRNRLQRLHGLKQAGYPLNRQDQVWLAELADYYGVDNTGEIDTVLLLRRVDTVPVALTLAQAAEESGWGTSRFAQQGNALFGQLTWTKRHTGIVPRDRRPGERHRFRSFEDLFGSVQSYMHNLNTHRAYLDFRRQRAAMRKAGETPDGYKLAAHILRYSERGQDYIDAVRQLIRVNDFADFERAVLLADAPEIVLHVAPDGADGTGVETAAEMLPVNLALPVQPVTSREDTAAVQTEDGAY